MMHHSRCFFSFCFIEWRWHSQGSYLQSSINSICVLFFENEWCIFIMHHTRTLSWESTCDFLVNVLVSVFIPTCATSTPPPPRLFFFFANERSGAFLSSSSCVLVPSPVFLQRFPLCLFVSLGLSTSWPSPHVLHLTLVYLPGLSPAEHCVCTCLIVPVTLCVFVYAGVLV